MKKIFYFFLLITGITYGQKASVIAHRGGSGITPENTLAAFNYAVSVNADYFELDVMFSSDDSLMIMHDATVDRTTDGTGILANMTYSELRQLDASSWFGATFAGEKLPTLFEALMVAKNDPNKIKVVIELKSSEGELPGAVVAMVQKLGMQNQVLVAGFSLSMITTTKTLDPTIPVMLFGAITTTNIDQIVAINGDWVGSSSYDQTLIDYAHMQGIYFNAWTLNSAPTMQAAMALGVDAITTDYPELMIILMDDTEPSDVLLTAATPNETKITLTWEAASDPETGITGYEIYRDETAGATTLLTIVGNVTEFTDDTYTEQQDYYYRVKAINAAMLTSVNYSNELVVTTLNDGTPPTVTAITSNGDSTTVIVVFSERVDKTIAETSTNYTLNYGETVSSAKLTVDQKSVILTTSPLDEQSYLLTVKNVMDQAITPNKMVTKSMVFIHYGLDTSTVAFYKLDSLYVSGTDTLVMDESVNNNDGINKNGAFITEGIKGNALDFDGVNDYVEFATSSSFDMGTNAVTISLWTKLPDKPADMLAPYGPLFDSDGDQYVIYADRANSELRFKVSTSASAERPGIPNADVPTNEWINVVGVYDGTNAMIYLNGELKDSHPITGTVKPGQLAFLGRSGTTYLLGSIDQVEIYNRALSGEEIIQKFNSINTDPISLNPENVTLQSVNVDQTDVTLTWSEGVNYESKIMGYEIYRDETPDAVTLYTTVGDVTEFVDKTNTGNTPFYYRVKAKNTRGLMSPDFSNELSVTTGTDVTRPLVKYVTSRGDATEIIIEFSEKLDPASAENAANYTIDQSITVSAASLAVNQKTVFLTTSEIADQSYTLSFNGIKDQAASPNQILPDTKVIFSHEGAPANLVAWYKMNEMPIVGTDTLLYDETANDNDGLVHNSPVVSEGYLGNAVKFDNTEKQYVQFANSPSFDINDSAVSISVWTKLTYLPVEMPEAYGPLFDSQGDEYVIYADKGNKELRFKVTVTTWAAARPGIPNDDLITGQWIHVMGVYDNDSARIYLNGVQKKALPLSGTVKAGTVPMLGKNGTAGTPVFFNGSIDNVQVFKAAFTPEEVMGLYQSYKAEAVFSCETYDTLEDVSVCEGETYTFPDGTTGNATGSHVSTLTSIYDCDSIVTTNLTVVNVDASVTESDGTATATVAGATYRWIDCDNGNAVIAGETSQSFTPSGSGNYAAEVTMNGCVVTSACLFIQVTGLSNPDMHRFRLYPNPNNGKFNVELNTSPGQVTFFEIINSIGQVILKEKINSSGTYSFELPAATTGIYIFKINTDTEIFEQRMIVM